MAKSKKKDQGLAEILRETAKLSLHDIRLIESHCKVGNMKEGSLPAQASHSLSLSVQPDFEAKSAVVVASFRLVLTYEDSEEGDPPFMISAKFGLYYTCKSPSRKYLEEAVARVAMLCVWPYLRELVQSMTTRMGLPPFPMPLVNVSTLAKANPNAETSTNE